MCNLSSTLSSIEEHFALQPELCSILVQLYYSVRPANDTPGTLPPDSYHPRAGQYLQVSVGGSHTVIQPTLNIHTLERVPGCTMRCAGTLQKRDRSSGSAATAFTYSESLTRKMGPM